MAVKNQKVYEEARRPSPPRWSIWLGMLLLFMLLGLMGGILFVGQAPPVDAGGIWQVALGTPVLVWVMAISTRVIIYASYVRVADGWDEARTKDLEQKYKVGRRSLQVWGTSAYTALRRQGVSAEGQVSKLLAGVRAIKSQPFRIGGNVIRHSCIDGDGNADPEQILLQAFEQVLTDLAQVLEGLADDIPLKVLVEGDSQITEATLHRIWRSVWCKSGVRQSTEIISDAGLVAVNQWLDRGVEDNSLLLIVAFQFAPEQPRDTAEVVVGLLLGSCSPVPSLHPIACLHRPEFLRAPDSDVDLSVQQALEWVPINACSIEHVWRSGVDRYHDSLVTMALTSLSGAGAEKKKFHDLDSLLGSAGKAAPWLAISLASESIKLSAGAQFVITGGSDDSLFCHCAVTPASPNSV
ncbi:MULTISPECIES: hypothetical protein [unclassified Pseudomonas]|uniref:hypothetical protein n=1 Tax=unclassified Pseudomonas TaxID=196821 RepID=UPI000EC56E0C|nr:MULTISPECIES: hypothetical protein [unclassified Pseudomonas]